MYPTSVTSDSNGDATRLNPIDHRITLDPIPKMCQERVACSYKAGIEPRCGCARKGLVRTSACNCSVSCHTYIHTGMMMKIGIESRY